MSVPANTLAREKRHLCVLEAAVSMRATVAQCRCKAGGAQRMAYPPVVAGGADACTIHYSRNDKVGGCLCRADRSPPFLPASLPARLRARLRARPPARLPACLLSALKKTAEACRWLAPVAPNCPKTGRML